MASRVLNFKIPTTPSGTMKEASRRVVALYRDCVRATPMAVHQHELKFTVGETKQRLRHLFVKHAGITDPKIVDMMVFKGYQDLEETLMLWNQRVHLERMLAPEEAGKFLGEKKEKTFLESFYEG